MSGHIVKIMLETTHPPVWRRVVLPEHISFYSLHKIIQIAFGWEDYHLHEFNPSDSRIRIMDPEGETWGEILSEYTTDLDDFLRNYKWIRYTYDFGDEWTHKITYEKEAPDYYERYATIIKAKGNNYIEDSGGGWEDEEEFRTPFDFEATNIKIRRIECPVVKGTKKLKEASHFHKNEVEMRKLAKEMMMMLKKTANMEKEASSVPSMVQKKLEKWHIFCEEKQEYESKVQKEAQGDLLQKEKSSYEQMTLPGIEVPQEPENEPSERYVLEKRESEHTSKDFLQHLDMKQIKDYCKYLGILAEDLMKNKLVDLVCKFLKDHPEYYLYILCNEDVKYLNEILTLPEGKISSPPLTGTINRLVALGLLDIKIENAKEKEVTLFYVAADVAKIFRPFKASFCDGIYKELKIRNERISYYVKSYGIIELNRLYDKYVEDFKDHIVRQDFFRVVYWHCRFNDFISTFVSSQDGLWYVASKEIDALKVYGDRLHYDADIDYYPFSKKELLSWKGGYGALYPCWHQLYAFFEQMLWMDNETMKKILDECYVHVIQGENCSKVLDAMDFWYYPDTIVEWLELWYALMHVCLNTGLPMLKAYSRIDYAKRIGRNPYELNLIDEEMIDDPIEPDSPFFDMPIEIQEELMDITGTTDITLKIRNLEKLFLGTGNISEDMMYLLTTYYIESEEFSKAEKMLKSLVQSCPEDQSVLQLKRVLSNKSKQRVKMSGKDNVENLFDLMPQENTTFQRMEKKIGRNEMCPCGSGKKYKHCCGRSDVFS